MHKAWLLIHHRVRCDSRLKHWTESVYYSENLFCPSLSSHMQLLRKTKSLRERSASDSQAANTDDGSATKTGIKRQISKYETCSAHNSNEKVNQFFNSLKVVCSHSHTCCRSLLDRISSNDTRQIRLLFDSIDTNGDGQLNHRELHDFASQIMYE